MSPTDPKPQETVLSQTRQHGFLWFGDLSVYLYVFGFEFVSRFPVKVILMGNIEVTVDNFPIKSVLAGFLTMIRTDFPANNFFSGYF